MGGFKKPFNPWWLGFNLGWELMEWWMSQSEEPGVPGYYNLVGWTKVCDNGGAREVTVKNAYACKNALQAYGSDIRSDGPVWSPTLGRYNLNFQNSYGVHPQYGHLGYYQGRPSAEYYLPQAQPEPKPDPWVPAVPARTPVWFPYPEEVRPQPQPQPQRDKPAQPKSPPKEDIYPYTPPSFPEPAWWYPSLDPISVPPLYPQNPQPKPIPFPFIPLKQPNPWRPPKEQSDWGPKPKPRPRPGKVEPLDPDRPHRNPDITDVPPVHSPQPGTDPKTNPAWPNPFPPPVRDPNVDITPDVVAPWISPDPFPQGNPRTITITSEGVQFGPDKHKRSQLEPGKTQHKGVSFPAWSGIIRKVFHNVTEVAEVIDCLIEAMPEYIQKRYEKQVKSKDNKGNWGVSGGRGRQVQSPMGVWQSVNPNQNYTSGLIGKLNFVDRYSHTIDVNKFVECMIANHLEDKIIGAMNQGAQKATPRPGFPVSGSWGPAL